jgi:hypothetical protein
MSEQDIASEHGDYKSLSTLETTVREAHEAVVVGESSALQHAIAAGLALLEIKARGLLKRGQLGAFYTSTCGGRQRAAEYLRLAEHRECIEAENVRRVGQLSLREALKLLRTSSRDKQLQRKEQPERKEQPKPTLGLAAMDDTAVTAELVALGFERFLQCIPPAWRSALERRAGGQFVARLKTEQPNVRLRHLKLISGGKDPPTAPTAH